MLTVPILVLLAGLGLAGAQSTCAGAGYDPSTYVCTNNAYLCPKTAPYACPATTPAGCYTLADTPNCLVGAISPAGYPAALPPRPLCNGNPYDTTAYVCPTLGTQGFLCPSTQPCVCTTNGGGCFITRSAAGAAGCSSIVCAGSTGGDPLVKGFDGCAWYLKGQPGDVLNLVSEAGHVVNTELVAAGLIDEHHNQEGTFHGAISLRYRASIVEAKVDSQGNLSVSLNNEPVPFGSVRERAGLTVKPIQHYPYYGQVVEVVTDAFRFFVHAVQPEDTAAGWSRGHLDFSASTLASNLVMHGLLGQSFNSTASLCADDFNFHGEGDEQDYKMADLTSTDFVYSQFEEARPEATRRLQSIDFDVNSIVYHPAANELYASSEGLFGKSF